MIIKQDEGRGPTLSILLQQSGSEAAEAHRAEARGPQTLCGIRAMVRLKYGGCGVSALKVQ